MNLSPEAPNGAKLQKVSAVRIFEQAVEQIRALIAGGGLAAGERLPTEQELSRQLNVSRSSVREALRVLEAEGLVEVRRGSGTFVTLQTSPSRRRGELARWLEQREETLEQVLQVRESIEGLTAALAAAHRTEAALQEMETIVAEQASLAPCLSEGREEDLDTLARLDAAFHLAVSSASGNDIAHEIIAHILPAFNESNKAVLYLGCRAEQMETEHAEILSALASRDSVKAEQTMRAHILQVKKAILEI